MTEQQPRARRTTAGQRLTLLTGEELDNDEAFWGHDTWQEDNESFHTSDEEASAAVDKFDSDFDATESEGEDEVVEAQAAERLLEAEEKDRKRKKSNYVDTATSNAKKSRKLTGIAAKRTKRIVGDGHNAGIVLNLPLPGTIANGTATGGPGETVHIPRIVVPGPSKKRKPSPTKPPPMAATRQRRQAKEASGYSSKSRTAKATNTTSSKHPPSSLRTHSNVQTHQQHRKQQQQHHQHQQFTQEQLLMEALTDTEPSNQRWLLGRQRRLAASEAAAVAATPAASATMMTVQWTSRRGALNTVTFGDMDKIPSMFNTTATTNGSHQKNYTPAVCAVTGAPARYKDPATGLPYATIEAFQTLRERHRTECAAKEEAARKQAAVKAAKQAESSAKEAAVVTTNDEETETTTRAKPKPKRKAQPRAQATSTTGAVGDSTTASKPAAVGKKKGGKAKAPKKPGRKPKAAPASATAVPSTTPSTTATSDPNKTRIATPNNATTTTDNATTSRASTSSQTSALHNPTPVLVPSTDASTATSAQPLPNNANPTSPAHAKSTNITTPTADICPPSPSCSQTAATTTTTTPDAPLSPGRRSERKRKPSAKLLASAELGVGSSNIGQQQPIPPPAQPTD